MAAIDFPAGAVATNRFTDAGKTWEFDGTAWNLIVTTLQVPIDSIDTSQIVNNAITSGKIADGTIVNADINASAGISHSKLASSTAGQVLLGTTGTGVITATTVSGDIAISGAGVTSIASGVVVDADINSAAAIALTKLASGTSAQVVVANASGVPTYTTVSGDVTISNTGVTTIGSSKITSAMIVDATIVNADISTTAAINTTKITNWEDDQVVLSQRIFS